MKNEWPCVHDDSQEIATSKEHLPAIDLMPSVNRGHVSTNGTTVSFGGRVMLATNMKHRSAASSFRWRCRDWHRWVAHNSAFPRARGLVHDAEVKLRQRGVQPGLDCEEWVLEEHHVGVKEEDKFTTWHLEYKINNVPLYPNDFVILPLPMVARRSRWRLHANAAVAVAKADGNGSKQDVAIRAAPVEPSASELHERRVIFI
jgi:hypothetical protein